MPNKKNLFSFKIYFFNLKSRMTKKKKVDREREILIL